ncbi:MAG: mechanosensitive ion channel family protein [Nitrospira sp.]
MGTHMSMVRLGLIGLALLVVAVWAAAAQRSMAETSRAPALKEAIAGAGQPGAGAGPLVQEPVPDDEFKRGTPRSMVQGFLEAARARDFDRAANYLDLRDVPAGRDSSQGAQLARQLKVVLDRVLWIDVKALSPNPAGEVDDELPAVQDRVGRIAGQARTYDVLLQRVPRGDGQNIWQFAGATVADLPRLYEEFGYGRLESVFPRWLFDVQFLRIEVWFWLALVSAFCLSFLVAMLLTSALIGLLRRIRPQLADEAATFLIGPLRLLIAVLLSRTVMDLLGLSLVAQAVAQAATVVVAASAWLGLRLLDLLAQRVSRFVEIRGIAGANALLKPAMGLLKAVLVVGAGLLWLDNLGFKVTTLLAGLSISGVAVALASQKSLENFFGAIALYSTQPVKVGDFCRAGPHMGTVEEIGPWATKIRTLERSVVTILNAQFVNLHLDNLTQRDRFWYHPPVRLRYGTTPDQIRYLLVEIRSMLYAHPRVFQDPIFVRFKEFAEYSLGLEVFAYLATRDYFESLEIAEDLNLRIMDLVAASGTELAIPAYIHYAATDSAPDEQRARAAEAQVKEWQDRRTLYLPNFPKEKIAELRGSLEYPPKGSPDSPLAFSK